MQRYEYKFVRIGEGWLGTKKSAEIEYKEEIRSHARDGWRLVQIFSPGTGAYGASKFYEMIFEKPCQS
jgi:hypothetical protein